MLRKSVGALFALLAAVGVFAFLVASPGIAQPQDVGSLATGPETRVPFGWIDFCQRYVGECRETVTEAEDVELTPKTMRTIERINRWVNKTIEPISDMEHWNVVDRWDYPNDGKGDCEDYALLKRRMLAEEGLPMQALLMTVVKDHKGDGHAVLTVRTSRGDYVLDNMNDEVKGWRQTGYKFVKRQSQTNANTWVALADPSERVYLASDRTGR